MRFATKFDRRLVIVLVLAAIASVGVVPAIILTAPGNGPPRWSILVAPSIWLLALFATLPQYCEVREAGLFLRQGWRKMQVPYESLVEIRHPMSDLRSAGVYSSDRLLLVTGDGRRFLIAVAERERFLAEVVRRSPQLEQGAGGLAVPLTPTTIG